MTLPLRDKLRHVATIVPNYLIEHFFCRSYCKCFFLSKTLPAISIDGRDTGLVWASGRPLAIVSTRRQAFEAPICPVSAACLVAVPVVSTIHRQSRGPR